MMIYSAITHMREGKIARHKKSYYCIHNLCLCRVSSKDYYIQGIAILSGEMFASDDWEKIEEYPKIKGRDYGLYSY